MSTGKTPIRVRGKRTGAKSEKWHTMPPQRTARTRDTMSLVPTSQSTNPARTVKRRRLDLSAPEQLPTELVQAIFVQSGNLDLPTTSRNFTAQLSGRQLQWELTCNALSPVVSEDEHHLASSSQLASASRLLNSRFMTWDFFRTWLDHLSDTTGVQVEEPRLSSDATWQSRYSDIWIALKPSPWFTLPSKAVRGPWTPDRIAFLKVFSLHPGGCSRPLDGIVAEVAHEGFAQAIEEKSVEAIKLLRNLQVKPDQDLLRNAVVDHGCDKDIVLYLLQWCLVELLRWNRRPANTDPRPAVDFLDPMLWAWANKAKAVGEPKGEWLTKTLRRLSSLALSDDVEELEQLEQDDFLYVSQWQ